MNTTQPKTQMNPCWWIHHELFVFDVGLGVVKRITTFEDSSFQWEIRYDYNGNIIPPLIKQ
jgi:hypothetical protein